MAVTEAAGPEVTGAAAPAATPAPTGGLAALLGTVNHVGIGRLYVLASLLFLVVGRVAGVLVGAERLDTSSVSILDDFAARVLNLSQVTDLYLFLVPAFIGVAIAVVPLQVGATTVAFPRAAAASFWAWFLCSGVLVASYFVDGGAFGDADQRDPTLLWIVGFAGLAISLLVAVVCVITTVLALRTAGMTVDRVPMFTWGVLVAATVWLVTLPVLVGALALFYVDVRYGAGLDSFNYLRWAVGVPQVFAFALPALGALLDVVPVAAGTRLRSRGVFLGAVALTGVLTFGADLLIGGQDPSIFQDALYVAGSFAVLLPLLAVAGGVADTLRRGRLSLTGPLLLGLVAFLLFLTGAVVNAVRVVDNLDLVGTSADDAVAALAVVAGLAGVAASLQFWAPKLLGAQLKEGLGRFAAVLLLLGGLALAVPLFIAGLLDQPTGLTQIPDLEDGVEALNAVSLIGGLVVLLGVMVVIVNLVAGRGSDDDDDEVPADPWGGHTLEWATASPPAPGGPGPIEPVTSATPLLDAKEVDA